MKNLNIRPGVLLMLTNVRVIQMLDPHSPSQGQRHVFMTSTAESQVTTSFQASRCDLLQVYGYIFWGSRSVILSSSVRMYRKTYCTTVVGIGISKMLKFLR